jgi:hypothetical protein
VTYLLEAHRYMIVYSLTLDAAGSLDALLAMYASASKPFSIVPEVLAGVSDN